jgi:hypothetical protein
MRKKENEHTSSYGARDARHVIFVINARPPRLLVASSHRWNLKGIKTISYYCTILFNSSVTRHGALQNAEMSR